MYEKEIKTVLERYKKLFGIDLSYMKFKVDEQPVYNDGSPCYEFDFDECGGDWTKRGFIRLNPDMASVMDRYGVERRSAQDVDDFAVTIIAHELAHEIWNRRGGAAAEKLKKDVVSVAEEEDYTTVYLDTVRPSKLEEETFCERMAKFVSDNAGVKGISFPDDELYSLEGRDVIWTTRVSDDFYKFNTGDVVTAPWGVRYRIDLCSVIYDVEDHPFYDELTDDQVERLGAYDQMKVLRLVKLDKCYKIMGAILGCLGRDAGKVSYDVTEKLDGDPWLAVIESHGLVDRREVEKWHRLHTRDVDGKGIPYYFCVRNVCSGRNYVLFSDEDEWRPTDTQAEKKAAVEAGTEKGIPEEQLDF